MSQSILYYPKINIEDSLWLRNAILYWDEVCSIVPEGIYLNSPKLQWLEKEGIYRPIRVNQDHPVFQNPNAMQELHHFINSTLKENGAILDKYSSNEIITAIHYNKLPPDLLDVLCANKTIIGNTEKEWYYGSERIMNRYMGILAKYIASYEANDMVIGTDKNSRIMSPFGRVYSKPENICIDLLFEKALPSPSLDCSFEEIIEFRKRHGLEFLQLRRKIRELEKQIAECENYTEMKFKIQSFRESWDLELKRLTPLLIESKIEFFLGTAKTILTMGIPNIINSFSELGGVIPKWLIGAATATCGVIGMGRCYVNQKNKNRALLDNEEFLYLFEAKKNGIIRKSDFLETI